MKDKIPAIVAIAILLLLLLGTRWAVEYAEKSIPIDPPAPKNNTPSAISGNFVMLTSDENNHPDMRLEGKHFRYFSDDESYEFDDPKSISQKVDQPRMTGTADLARLTDDGDTVKLTGNAHLHRVATEDESQLDIYSEELYIYPNRDFVESFVPTTVVQGKSTLKGTGMTYNNKTRQLHVTSRTDATLSPEDMNRGRKSRKKPDSEPTHNSDK